MRSSTYKTEHSVEDDLRSFKQFLQKIITAHPNFYGILLS